MTSPAAPSDTLTPDLVREHHPDAAVWSVPTLKPLDEARLVTACAGPRAVVTFEEHSAAGGLGSLVAEVLAEDAQVPVLRIGVAERFSEHCGSYEYLLHEHEHGLDAFVTRIAGPAAQLWHA